MTWLGTGTSFEGVAGDLQLHPKLAPGGGRSQREINRASGVERHRQ